MLVFEFSELGEYFDMPLKAIPQACVPDWVWLIDQF